MKTDSAQDDRQQEWAWLLLIAPLSAMMTILTFVDSFILWAIGIAVAIALPLFLFHLNRRESKIRDVAENYIQLWRSTPELDRTNREHSLLIKTGACNLWTNAELTEARRRIKAKDARPKPLWASKGQAPIEVSEILQKT